MFLYTYLFFTLHFERELSIDHSSPVSLHCLTTAAHFVSKFIILCIRQPSYYVLEYLFNNSNNHKNYNFLDCDWFKNLLFSTNSLAKLSSDSLLLDSLLSDSLFLDSSISQSHLKLLFKSTNLNFRVTYHSLPVLLFCQYFNANFPFLS